MGGVSGAGRPRRYRGLGRASVVLVLGLLLAACGQATEAAPVTGGQTERPAPGLTRVAQPRYAPTDFQAGVMVLVYGNDPAFAAKSAALLDRLARLGVNSVGFVFPIFQKGTSANDVYASDITPSDANINTFLAQAHRRGFTVMMRPLLDEQSPAFSGYWRGNIKPAGRAAWWTSYNRIILKYAQLGQGDGATIFDVGTEMTTMQGDTAQWVGLVNSVRQVFKGQLTYSTNWDQRFPAFGTALDFIAIDGWFPLKVAPGADPAPAVQAAWKPWLDQVHQDAVRLGKPAIFTELGIASQRGALTQPWAQLTNVPADNDVQRAYYAGTCAAVKGAVSGLYWWDFELNPPATNDNGFVPQGKPAEMEVGRCFAQPGIPS